MNIPTVYTTNYEVPNQGKPNTSLKTISILFIFIL